MNPNVPIAVFGASGRMGQAILRLALHDSRVAVLAAVVRAASPRQGAALGSDFGAAAGTLRYVGALDRDSAPAVLIDFSSADSFDAALAAAVSRRIAFVSGTTGLGARQQDALHAAAATIPVMWSANFSIGVAVLARLARDAARTLSGWDCEIAEAHHRYKKDAPSGTALELGRTIAKARGEDFDRVARLDRTAASTSRSAATIGFAVTRAGDIVGEHTVLFAADGERIELTHRATDRDIFARGALEAAAWIVRRPPGLYSMSDMLER